jgi:mannose-1-phosphate guanylyltransferase
MDNYYALIMAGGGGTRLWPLSRTSRPKQMLALLGSRSMFQIAVERLAPLFPPERIFVVAGPEMTVALREQAPDLPPENFIIEPAGRDSAPAIGLGTITIAHRDPEAIIAVLAADHYIADTETFRRALGAAGEIASEGHIVTLGITPDYPATGFGYIKQGRLDRTVDDLEAHIAEAFTEKPDPETAERFLQSGRYSWNSGMFVWTARRVLAEFERQRPEMYKGFQTLAAAIESAHFEAALAETWPTIERISVDFAIMEGAQGVRVIPVSMGWSDIGSWGALYDVLATEAGRNISRGREPLFIDSAGALVFSERLVAIIGLDDVVVVDTDDAILICSRERSQDVKTVVQKLKQNDMKDYL